MGKGYAEGPAAEEAERRREEAASGASVAHPDERAAVMASELEVTGLRTSRSSTAAPGR